MKERRLLALATGEDSFDCEGGIESISRVVAAGERRLPGTGSEAIGQVFTGLLGTGFEGKLMVIHLHSWVQAAY